VRDLNQLLQALAEGPAVLVRVTHTEGSSPREAGTWMAVTQSSLIGTIGGGHLEYDAMQLARQMLLQGAPAHPSKRYALGPSLGQCCGGAVQLRFDRVDQESFHKLKNEFEPAAALPIALFGGGHVGRAIVAVLSRLPARIHWIDSRDEIFPPELPENVRCDHSNPVQDAVRDVVPGSYVLIMSFSHAQDLDILANCLHRMRARADLAYIGLIGSKTKWAVFARRLGERGFAPEELAHVTCPIGLPGIPGKEPEVIAVSVAAQILQVAGAQASINRKMESEFSRIR
jgi:xanthine dehydrogenase accessory factor